jgi:hypothetical protein
MDVLYYYYYLFYTKVLPDNEPHATVVFTLSFSESLLVNFFIDFVGVHLTCGFVSSKWSMIGVFIIIGVINYLVYFRTNRREDVLTRKPKFLQSNRASIALTAIFVLFSSSLLFWGSIYLMGLIEQC